MPTRRMYQKVNDMETRGGPSEQSLVGS